MDKFFLVQIKQTSGAIEKGVVVKETLEAAKQSYHAYLGAYAYGNNAQTDYVMCEILDAQGNRKEFEVWDGTIVPDIGE